MQKFTIAMSFSSHSVGEKSYTRSFDSHDDLDRTGWDYLAGHMFRECEMELFYRNHRQDLPRLEGFSEASDWSPSQSAVSDLTKWAAQQNTAETWLQIQNAFFETAHLLAQSRAYKDLEANEADEDKQLLIHLIKMQFFNSAAFVMNKIEDLFLLLLFVNSGCSLVPTVDVRRKDWPRDITRGAIYKGLKLRRSELCCGRFRNTNSYLDALADDDYRTIRSVLKRLGSPLSVRTIRNYRNSIAHRGLPAVDRPMFSPAYRFPEQQGSSMSLGLGGGASVEYSFLEMYEHAVSAVKHYESQLRRVKAIPILVPR
ncbi:MAG: hypothetical protein WAN08_06810 [Candidatus Sulfotelmatobacter sp.]